MPKLWWSRDKKSSVSVSTVRLLENKLLYPVLLFSEFYLSNCQDIVLHIVCCRPAVSATAYPAHAYAHRRLNSKPWFVLLCRKLCILQPPDALASWYSNITWWGRPPATREYSQRTWVERQFLHDFSIMHSLVFSGGVTTKVHRV